MIERFSAIKEEYIKLKESLSDPDCFKDSKKFCRVKSEVS